MKHTDDELPKYWDKYPACDLNRERFSDVFLPTWEKTITISNITSGFRATSIYPFDKNIPPAEAFTPSLPTHRLEAQNEEVDSDYHADDYFPLETLRQKLNTAENSFSEVNMPVDVKL
ncbi:hypothetical protein Trydic_g2772 [Trypoxylus dichotomus]